MGEGASKVRFALSARAEHQRAQTQGLSTRDHTRRSGGGGGRDEGAEGWR
jgi:hypothetical protein